ncbi:MAG: ATP-binding protein, partial [Syntrophales bacterium LBB04]|nr:ATP-binding protein [Syntrophales bacterium LBB04]
VGEIRVVLEEVFVNICRYAYAGGRGEVEISCSSEGGDTVIEFIDSGVAFDITALELPDTCTDIDELNIGGLGCLLIRKLMDMVVYRREGDRNILRLTSMARK